MSFELQSLRKFQKSGMVTWWNYTSVNDTVNTISGRGYFELAQDRFTVGDWIYCTGSNGGCILHVDEITPLEMSHPKT